eukprot:CAMPEP_0173447024 /NCGR_PEP_ID=MMETSP1357-20121228/37837_1 /TAXON_ID=77926 /ORGANISM="Hemiselmis rufescens, Strain PCC563" /LENGTH=35 /DNA_ID= /DNA_START= /DNA_END= /DNA_ORIENTATION=
MDDPHKTKLPHVQGSLGSPQKGNNGPNSPHKIRKV